MLERERQMEPELAAALLGAFVGAIGGGAASLAGSVIVNRRELRRKMRIRIYDELLPKLIKENFSRTAKGEVVSKPASERPTVFNHDLIREIERASVLAGRRIVARVRNAEELMLDKYRYDLSGDEHKVDQSDREIGRALFELNDYLARKLV
jgi:hypothetical protein